jgi:hypothetical protein
MVALANSNGRQDSLETQLSEAVALASYELSNDASKSKVSKADAKEPYPGLTTKLLYKKELKKLRQKTRKKLLGLQGDDENLNKSVEELINSTEHPLDLNDNCENSLTNNNTENLPNSDKSKPRGIAGIAESSQSEEADELIANKDTYNNVAPVQSQGLYLIIHTQTDRKSISRNRSAYRLCELKILLANNL